MSLLESASPWDSAPVSTKKKATMKKLVYGKKNNILTRPAQPSIDENDNEYNNADMEEEPELSERPRIENDMDKNNERHKVVHEHIKNMTSSMPGPMNAGDFLASFKPISENPLLPKAPTAASFKEYFTQKNPESVPVPTTSGDSYSNYNSIYQSQKTSPYYARMGLGNSATSGDDNKLMEKINYLIHLLEEQQAEKTNYVTEEFLLYGFLGIFMIFVVDSFSKAGKYVR